MTRRRVDEAAAEQPRPVRSWVAARARPHTYPGDHPGGSYVVVDDSVVDLRVDDLARPETWRAGGRRLADLLSRRGLASLDERVPVLAYGANRNPASLALKLDHHGYRSPGRGLVLPVLSAALDGFDVVAGGLSQQGFLYADLYADGRTTATTLSLHVLLLDDGQLRAVHDSERVGVGNYDVAVTTVTLTGSSGSPAPASAGGTTDDVVDGSVAGAVDGFAGGATDSVAGSVVGGPAGSVVGGLRDGTTGPVAGLRVAAMAYVGRRPAFRSPVLGSPLALAAVPARGRLLPAFDAMSGMAHVLDALDLHGQVADAVPATGGASSRARAFEVIQYLNEQWWRQHRTGSRLAACEQLEARVVERLRAFPAATDVRRAGRLLDRDVAYRPGRGLTLGHALGSA